MYVHMPFGKYRGRRIDSLPRDYLRWLLSLDDLSRPLRDAVEAAYNKNRTHREERTYSDQHFTGACNGTADSNIVAELVAAGFRALAKKYHPDHGGDHAQMVAINSAMEWLRSKLWGWR